MMHVGRWGCPLAGACPPRSVAGDLPGVSRAIWTAPREAERTRRADRRGWNQIFMTGSVASIKGFPGYSVYAASKATLHAFARGWLNELKSRNIRVNVLHPGPIATPMQDQVLTPEAKQMFESLIPRGKMGRPEEIATAALFLASDDSSFGNGLELYVDGGFSPICCWRL